MRFMVAVALLVPFTVPEHMGRIDVALGVGRSYSVPRGFIICTNTRPSWSEPCMIPLPRLPANGPGR